MHPGLHCVAVSKWPCNYYVCAQRELQGRRHSRNQANHITTTPKSDSTISHTHTYLTKHKCHRSLPKTSLQSSTWDLQDENTNFMPLREMNWIWLDFLSASLKTYQRHNSLRKRHELSMIPIKSDQTSKSQQGSCNNKKHLLNLQQFCIHSSLSSLRPPYWNLKITSDHRHDQQFLQNFTDLPWSGSKPNW